MMRGWVWIGVLLGVCALAFGQQKLDVEQVDGRWYLIEAGSSANRL